MKNRRLKRALADLRESFRELMALISIEELVTNFRLREELVKAHILLDNL